MIATTHDIKTETESVAIEDSMLGWFLIVSTLIELLFNRLFTAMGIYTHVGEAGVLGGLSNVGLFAMNSVAVCGVMLACILLPKLAADPLLGPLPARVLLMLTSPLYIPVICVAIFRPISPPLVLVAYLVSVGSIVYLAGLVGCIKLPGSHKRLLIALALIHISAAVELLLGGYYRSSSQKAHVFAEGIYLVTPVFAYIFVFKKNLVALLMRPHVLGLSFAALMTAIALGVIYHLDNSPPMALILTGFRALGVTFAIPGGTILYLVSLFIGAYVVGTLVLPSKKWPPDSVSRRMGIGLACIWSAGIQSTHPYQAILVVTGFLYVTRSMLDGEFQRRQSELISMQLSIDKN